MKTFLSIWATLLLLTGAAVAATISGFVDASWFLDGNAETHTFGLDQAEVDVIHELDGDLVLRADIEWVKDGDGWAQDLEQGFLAWSPRALDGTVLSFGKFNAPIGFELLDAPDMDQFSHSLLFDHGLPTNLTGAMLSRDLTDALDVTAYWVNGWDVNQAPDDAPKTFGGRLGYTQADQGGVGVSVITGREIDAGDEADPLDDLPFDRTVIDVDLSLTPAAGWTLGGELNLGTVDPEAGAQADWTGLMLMAHKDVTERVGLTVRFDRLDDADGAVFGNGADVRSSFTIAPTFVLGDGLGALFELRQDRSDHEIWTDADGMATDTALTAAFEMTATF